MYRPGEPPRGPPPFRPFPPGLPYNVRGPSTYPPNGPVPPGPYSVPPPDINFIHNIPRRDDFNRSNCSSFSIDASTVIGLGGSRQIVSPADPPQQHVPQWNSTPGKNLGDSDQAGEVFLRCLAANKPLPDYLKGDMAYNLAEALKSASVLKDTLKSDHVFNKIMSRSRSRGRSRGKSRANSCGRSKSRARSRSRRSSSGRSKSRGRSRSRRSRSRRSRSRTRGKSLARDKSRIRSRSRSHSKKRHARSKSRLRRSKSRSRSRSTEKRHSKDSKMKMNLNDSKSNIMGNNDQPGKSLVEGLKMVMKSKELEERLPDLKDAILTIKASKEGKSQTLIQENSSLENESTVLPHDRVGSDFFWLQTQTAEATSGHPKADELEDEESFLYGKEVTERRDKSGVALFPEFSQNDRNSKPQDTTLADKQRAQTPFSNSGSQRPVSVNLERREYAKVKDIMNRQSSAEVRNTVSPASAFPAGTAVNSTMPPMKTSNIQQALESLQSLIKATKEKRERNEGSGMFLNSDKQRACHIEYKKQEKHEKITQIECLMKELNELMTKDGLGFLTPVIGFYCQKCEEFIGDLGSAENHASVHQEKTPSGKVQTDTKSEQKQDGAKKELLHPLSSGHQHHQEPDPTRQIHRDYKSHKDLGNRKPHVDHQQDWGNHRNSKERHGDVVKNEMCKERMLITVGLGPTPSNVKINEEGKKELSSQPGFKVEDKNKKNQSKGSGGKDKHNNSDDSDEGKKKSKKKKKDKDKKKKKKKGDKS